VHAARFAGPAATDDDNVALVLERLRGVPLERRRARFVTVAVASFPDGRELAAIGTADGAIASERRGHGGFGYDSVFIADAGDGRTFAELTPSEKDACSHRGAAFRTLAEGLAILDQAGHLDPPDPGSGGRGERPEEV
jgi:XTP/dITP diphosphohydrolase